MKAPEKIGAAAARILARNHGKRYYDWEIKEERFSYFEHPVNFKQEQALEAILSAEYIKNYDDKYKERDASPKLLTGCCKRFGLLQEHERKFINDINSPPFVLS